MTEELKQKAEQFAEKHSFRVPYDGSNKFYDDTDYKASKDGYIAGATEATKELQKENERLAKHILELQKDKGRLADENKRISIQYAEETDETIKELEAQIEELKKKKTMDTCEEPCKLLKDTCLIAGRVKDLEAQIERMKDCRSCKHDSHCNHRVCDKSLPLWELAE